MATIYVDDANLILCPIVSTAKRRLSYINIGIFAYIENRLWNAPEPVHKSTAAERYLSYLSLDARSDPP